MIFNWPTMATYALQRDIAGGYYVCNGTSKLLKHTYLCHDHCQFLNESSKL